MKTVREAKKLERRFLLENRPARQLAARGNGSIPENEVDDRGNTLRFMIEKGVPMPLPRGAIYPLAEMEVGDSFSCPLDLRAKVKDAVSSFQRHHAAKFTVRTANNNCRVWRIR